MYAVTARGGGPGRPLRGRRIWGLSGLLVIAAIAIPCADFITSAWTRVPVTLTAVPSPVITVPQPVTSVDVQSYGLPVQVTVGQVASVQVSEQIAYDAQDGGPPAVQHSVSRGVLTLDAPSCAISGCEVGFTVTVPPPGDVTATVASEGGGVLVSGIAGATVNSGGGAVNATGIHGPLTVTTDGGAARLVFAAPPRAVIVSTEGGPALITLPGGPYAVTADSGGGHRLIGIATDPAAPRTIDVSSGGGPLQVEPAAG